MRVLAALLFVDLVRGFRISKETGARRENGTAGFAPGDTRVRVWMGPNTRDLLWGQKECAPKGSDCKAMTECCSCSYNLRKGLAGSIFAIEARQEVACCRARGLKWQLNEDERGVANGLKEEWVVNPEWLKANRWSTICQMEEDAEAAQKVEVDRLAAEAEAEEERLVAETATRAEDDRVEAEAKAEEERLAAEAARACHPPWCHPPQ